MVLRFAKNGHLARLIGGRWGAVLHAVPFASSATYKLTVWEAVCRRMQCGDHIPRASPHCALRIGGRDSLRLPYVA
jgi:hypothetical protein